MIANDGWENPIPIDRPVLPKFPVDMLPEPIREWVVATAEYTQTPVELPALLALAACSGCVARRYEIDCGWREPINLWVAVLLEPANRKSTVYSAAFRPVREIERLLIEIAKPENAKRSAEISILKQRLDGLKKKAAQGNNADAMREAGELAEQLARTPEPVLPKLLMDDSTPEALELVLASQGGRVIVSGAEGGAFQIMAGKTSKFTNMEVFLKGHAGDDLRVDRVTRGSLAVERVCLTLGYAIQPEVIRGLVSKSTFRGCGLLARFLWAVPMNNLGNRKIETEKVAESVEQKYHLLLEQLFFLGERVQQEQVETLYFCPQASARFVQWRREVESCLREGGTLETMLDWGGKLCGLTARLAAVIRLIEIASVSGSIYPVDETNVEIAIAISKWAIPHAKAAFGLLGDDDGAMADAERILDWLKAQNKTRTTQREVHQQFRSRFDDEQERLEKALELLVHRGWLRPVDITQSGPGRKSKQFDCHPWVVNPPRISGEL